MKALRTIRPMEFSDDDILKRVQQGERDAYLLLFDRYYARVERYARWQMRDPEAGRDLASETFLRAFRNVDHFRIGENITYLGYLLMICRRLVLTELARQRNAPLPLPDDGHERDIPVDMADLPLARLLDGERNAVIREALDRLAPDDREIILLAFERDLSRQDIMVVMEKPSVSAVTSHLYRAMQKLRALVAQEGYFAT